MTLARHNDGSLPWAEENHIPPCEGRLPVFDRAEPTPVSIAGYFDNGPPPCPIFRCTAADRRPARRTVTAAVLGDPAPGRSGQDAYERAKCNSTTSQRRGASSLH